MAPVIKAATSAIGQATPALPTSKQKIEVPRAMIEGNDKSISPVMTTKVRARAIKPNWGVVCANAA